MNEVWLTTKDVEDMELADGKWHRLCLEGGGCNVLIVKADGEYIGVLALKEQEVE